MLQIILQANPQSLGLDATTIITLIGTIAQIAATLYIYSNQKKSSEDQLTLSQRHFYHIVYNELKELYVLDYDKNDQISWKLVRDMTHKLEFVGLCCESTLVDVDLIKRAHSTAIIKVYDSIYRLVPSTEDRQRGEVKSGSEIILDCPAATTLYNMMKTEITQRNVGTSLKTQPRG